MDTILGPACLGDIITTGFSHKSRNRLLGMLASKCVTGIPKRTFIAEGRNNAKVIRNLASDYGLETPIAEFVHSVLEGKMPLIFFGGK